MPSICSVCKKEGGKLCSVCSTTVYCSPACQRADWPKHKKVCLGRASSKTQAHANAKRGKKWDELVRSTMPLIQRLTGELLPKQQDADIALPALERRLQKSIENERSFAVYLQMVCFRALVLACIPEESAVLESMTCCYFLHHLSLVTEFLLSLDRSGKRSGFQEAMELLKFRVPDPHALVAFQTSVNAQAEVGLGRSPTGGRLPFDVLPPFFPAQWKFARANAFVILRQYTPALPLLREVLADPSFQMFADTVNTKLILCLKKGGSSATEIDAVREPQLERIRAKVIATPSGSQQRETMLKELMAYATACEHEQGNALFSEMLTRYCGGLGTPLYDRVCQVYCTWLGEAEQFEMCLKFLTPLLDRLKKRSDPEAQSMVSPVENMLSYVKMHAQSKAALESGAGPSQSACETAKNAWAEACKVHGPTSLVAMQRSFDYLNLKIMVEFFPEVSKTPVLTKERRALLHSLRKQLETTSTYFRRGSKKMDNIVVTLMQHLSLIHQKLGDVKRSVEILFEIMDSIEEGSQLWTLAGWRYFDMWMMWERCDVPQNRLGHMLPYMIRTALAEKDQTDLAKLVPYTVYLLSKIGIRSSMDTSPQECLRLLEKHKKKLGQLK